MTCGKIKEVREKYGVGKPRSEDLLLLLDEP
jgi:hypothetical protein